MEVSAKAEARFWARVDKSGGDSACWLWRGYCHRNGHGQLKITALSKTPLFAHRVAYQFTYRVDVAKFVVRHTCDNPPCVNPKHLELGTQRENMLDMKLRKRAAFGERNGRAIVTELDVKRIREMPRDATNKAIGKQFGLSGAAVRSIRKRITWKHVS